MIDFTEAIERRIAALQPQPPVDPSIAETERLDIERQKAEEKAENERVLQAHTLSKIEAHQAELSEYHRFTGTKPEEIFTEGESELLANFLSTMGTYEYPGIKVLSSKEKRLQEVQRRRLLRTQMVIEDGIRSIPVTSGYLIGCRPTGWGNHKVIYDEVSLGSVNYREGSFESRRQRWPTVNKVYVCLDGLLREVDDNTSFNKEAYILGQWVVTTSVQAFTPSSTLVVCNGDVYSRSHRRTVDSYWEFNSGGHTKPDVDVTETRYLEGTSLANRLHSIILGMPLDSL